MPPTIGYLCITPSHTTIRLGRNAQTMTMQMGAWAYCSAGLSGGHIWQATDGVDYDDLFPGRVDQETVGGTKGP
jgi:hypothetical protein